MSIGLWERLIGLLWSPALILCQLINFGWRGAWQQAKRSAYIIWTGRIP